MPLQLKSVLRRQLFKREKDHLQNKNSYLSDHMAEYFHATGGQPTYTAAVSARACGLEDATRELEREHLRLQRLAHQSNKIVAYRREQVGKQRYLTTVFDQFPEMRSIIDPLRDCHTMSLHELRVLVTRHKETFRMERAARRLQNFWRSRISKKRGWLFFSKQFNAAALIQKNWRISKWIRVINRAAKERRTLAATMCQRYLRGYVVRRDTLEAKVFRHLVMNFDYFDEMKRRLHTDA